MSDTRFGRSEMLLGGQAIEKLARAHVLVCGLGGVGSFACEALARGGVGRLTLLDFDRVSRSNCNRQLVALESTLGQYKTEVMARRVRDINPGARVTELRQFYEEDGAPALFALGFDYVVDAIDTVGPKVSLIAQAHGRGVPCISALGTGNKLDPMRFEVADIYSTSVCPLARVVRRELKKRGVASHKVLYSREPPLAPSPPPGDEGQERRSTPGSVSFTPSVAGLLLAREVILDLIGRP